MDLYIDGEYLTNLLGDGLILSTPTGSTGYNMSASGSIVMTNADAFCLTPLAPHSLSFRPLILPSSAVIKVRKPKDGRSAAWVTLDGSYRFELEEGEELTVKASNHNIGFVVDKSENLVSDWVAHIAKLNWNRRDKLKNMDEK